MSLILLDRKMADIAATEADYVATSNPGCIAQIEAGCRRAGARAKVVHVVELLALSYKG
jgi:glycolate oxidase iron-sulfur subunit